jgi:hypothetical protein
VILLIERKTVMNATNSSRPALRWLAVGAGFATALYATHAGFTWLRYGHPASPASDETDQLLDQFIPDYEVVERHRMRVAAPAETTLAAARDMDLWQSALVRGIFKGRGLILGSHSDNVRRPRTLLAQAMELGWAVLGQIPDREIVFGAVTRPWVANPVFRPVPPDEFASFREPGYAKIVWTLRADPIGATESVARSETRVATTDPVARAAFRRYWSFFSPGIELIRWISLGLVKEEAERRMRAARQDRHSVELQGMI